MNGESERHLNSRIRFTFSSEKKAVTPGKAANKLLQIDESTTSIILVEQKEGKNP
jgi:hypothetical protein